MIIKQQKAEYNDSAVFKNLNHSVDIIPESMSLMTFNTRKEASKFAEDMIDKGYHIIEIKDDYRRS